MNDLHFNGVAIRRLILCLMLVNVGIATELQGVYNTDSAVAGEAASIATGLVMLGTADGETIESIINYAHSTEHEKIIRGSLQHRYSSLIHDHYSYFISITVTVFYYYCYYYRYQHNNYYYYHLHHPHLPRSCMQSCPDHVRPSRGSR